MSDRFWDEVAPLQATGRLEEGTMFGFRCVRAGKAFVAMPGHESDGMVVKLRAARVSELPVARPGRRPARSSRSGPRSPPPRTGAPISKNRWTLPAADRRRQNELPGHRPHGEHMTASNNRLQLQTTCGEDRTILTIGGNR